MYTEILVMKNHGYLLELVLNDLTLKIGKKFYLTSPSACIMILSFYYFQLKSKPKHIIMLNDYILTM